MSELARYNLGAGNCPVEGYDNSFDLKDGKDGKKAFPLELPDNSADEIRASHLLEHFSHRATHLVLADWVRALKPGGLLKLAVPDFQEITRMYQAGEPGMIQSWLMGGQTNPLDGHNAIFDRAVLESQMRRAGLVGIHHWTGGEDCSAYDISLNLAGWKRPASWPKVAAVMSRPRLGFMDQFGCAMEALSPLGIPVVSRTGAYWGKCLAAGMEAAIDMGAEFVLTLDYDTLFTQRDVEDLMAYAITRPDIAAFVPVQSTRVKGLKNPLLFNPLRDTKADITLRDLQQTFYPILTGHFGCTMFRVEALKELPKPWFQPTFKEDGSHKYDDDINFWLAFEKAGLAAVLTPRVVVGHLETVVMWPGKDLKVMYQRSTDWRDDGKPQDVWR